MAPVSDAFDDGIGIPIKSLYGKTLNSLCPAKEDIAELDALVVDLTDIGSRYYTYAQTLAYAMTVAGENDVKVLVLDRPNPIGGNQIEGSPLSNSNRSFCGIGPIANRHGLTIGELAFLFRDGFGDGDAAIEKHPCELEVVPVTAWNRSMYLDDTDIPWLPPSPNMMHLETAIVYPGACLFEATNISEGRGTVRPFQTIGAPFIDSEQWIAATENTGIPLEGASLQAIEFTPRFQKHAGTLCRGVQIHIHERLVFKPYRFGIALMAGAAKAFPNDFKWREEPYEFIADIPAIDLLYCDSSLCQAIEGDFSIETVFNQMEDFESWFDSARTPYLRY